MGRLFWKLFFAFWLAFVVIGFGALISFKLYRDYLEWELFEQSARPEVHTVASTLEEEGEEAAVRLIHEIHRARKRLFIVVVDSKEQSLPGLPLHPRAERILKEARRDSLRFPTRKVTTPKGKTYWVIALDPQNRGMAHERRREHWLTMQWMGLSISVVVCLFICFGLARYLSRPIKQLSSASRNFSEGELSIRVSPALGNRKDEIADLAGDFDNMAEKLQGLIDGQKRLLRDVSHELRSPLARLQMAVGLARKRREHNLESEELDRIEKDVARLEELVKQVLTLSRLETDLPDAHEDCVDINELICAVVEDADFEAQQRNCRVLLTACVELEMMANAELLHQALENIVRNAVRYTEPGTDVEVSSSQSDTRLVIEVCDQGPGVPDDQLSGLFEPFVRLSAAREHTGGFGLGLAIAQRAIARHGGKISARNRASGGLCVSVELPLNSRQEA
ncbi:ATP-binding protein [Porticoccaceae bacterium LTM1]|nr:ATP-binding protein [Porticoccaceae bacterium LTM1]